MTRGSRVAKRYARALLEVADRGQVEAWGAELERLAAVVEAPEMLERLTSPELSEADRQKAMQKIAEQLKLSFPLRSFAVVLASHGRIREIGAVAESYRDQVDDLLGRTRATLTFAVQPSDADIARVAEGLSALARKTVIPTVRVDKEILGGVIAEIGGKIYDGSLVTRLAEARRRLAGEAG
jgi:F-type H+-transporting ATPase subunit delta